jgi:hypothetical protein
MSITDEEEKIRIRLGAKLATSVKTLSGTIVLYHDGPFTVEVIEAFKTMTVEEISQQLLGDGFEAHNSDNYFNN